MELEGRTQFLIAQATAPNPGPNQCNDILKVLAELLLSPWSHQPGRQIGLAPRYFQQIYGQHKPGTPKWNTHDQQFRGQQRTARELLKDFKRCGGGDPPKWTRWVNIRAPSAHDWKGGGVPQKVREKLDEQWGNAIVARRVNTTESWKRYNDWWSGWAKGFLTVLAAIGTGLAFVGAIIKLVLWDWWQPAY